MPAADPMPPSQLPSEVLDVAVAVAHRGVIVAGALDEPAVPWWSFTKTAIAAAALVLVERGQIALDSPVTGRPWSLRQLLQHRAGIPEYGALKDYHAAVESGAQPWPVEELLTRVKADQLLFEPDTGWRYSNAGYLLVRQLIEEATGEDIGQAMARLVFEPLGLTVGLARTPGDLALTRWGNAAGYHPGWVYHGLLVGPPAGAAVFLDRLLGGHGSRLLSARSLDAMQDGHRIEEAAGTEGRPWRRPCYGLGLMIEAGDGAPRMIGHTGGGPTTTSAVYYFPSRDLTAAAFAPSPDPSIVEHRVIALASRLS
jgi:D-alanyl-D-alanine carboxypeptidase